MSLSDQFEGKTSQEKNQIKFVEFCKLTNMPIFPGHGFDIEILDVSSEGDLLRVVVRAWKNGQEVLVDNPLLFKNPPILVPDGTFTEVTDDHGKQYNRPNFKEDVSEALRQMIAETLRLTVN